MGKIAGVKFVKNTRCKNIKVTIDLNKWGEDIQDFLGHITVLERRKDKTLSFEKVVKKLDAKHGISRIKK